MSRFVYTNSALSFFSSPEGRVIKNGSNYEYQYAIADHQGNTRVVFTSAAPITQNVSAGFETANQASETGNFATYPSGSHISTVAAYANTGTNSLYLNGGYSGQVGVPKSYKVYPGDKVQIQAYAKYATPSGTPSNLTGFATALLNAFNLAAPVAGETGTASSAINTFGGLEASGWGDGSNDYSDPRVFVNIVLFDKNYKFIDVTYAQLTTSGALMSASYTAKEEGYAYLYVSNEQQYQTDVYFDDVAMSYTPGNIIQSNEFYPFGLQTANSWTRDNTSNNFLANGGTELNSTSQLYDLDFRNYDPILGRLNQVDPLASTYSSASPYHYSFNNPIAFNDPSGADPYNGFYGPGPGDPWDHQHMGSDVAFWHPGGNGVAKYDATIGNYFMDENGNGQRDGMERTMDLNQVQQFYGSALSVTTYTGDQVRANIMWSFINEIGMAKAVGLYGPDGRNKNLGATYFAGPGAGPGIIVRPPTDLVLPWWARLGGTAINWVKLGAAVGVDALAFLMVGDAATTKEKESRKIWYHYTNAANIVGIMNSARILPNAKGKVYITDIAFSAADAFQNLFLSQTTHLGKGDYVVAFYLDKNQESQLTYDPIRQPFEYVWQNGTLKIDQVLWGGPNPFK